MTTYKEFLQSFKFACKVHRAELAQLDQVKDKESENQLDQFIEKDLQVVKETFDKIDEVCGPSARVLVWLMYVEEKSAEEIGSLFGLPSNTVRRKISEWLKKTFEKI